jgi:hypothetical protein
LFRQKKYIYLVTYISVAGEGNTSYGCMEIITNTKVKRFDQINEIIEVMKKKKGSEIALTAPPQLLRVDRVKSVK